VKYPTIILFEVFEITKKSGGKKEARLLKFSPMSWLKFQVLEQLEI
jgi:hypothetical protein